MDDFLQLIVDKDYGEEKVRFLINRTLKTYKWLCKKLKNHIINFSQLNRNIENRLDGKPSMSDFYESGLIEILSELCVIQIGDKKNEEMTYHILKARHGKVGEYRTTYQPEWCKIDMKEGIQI
jgi:replicative DNA helicase